VLKEYCSRHFKAARPDEGLEQRVPTAREAIMLVSLPSPCSEGFIMTIERRRDHADGQSGQDGGMKKSKYPEFCVRSISIERV
jgi:hypothetical protein